MKTPQSFDRVILKVLNGVQAGAEVSLIPGEYTAGTGEDDDIQFIDVSIKSGQARIRIGAGTIEIAGGTGSVVIGNGETLSARSDFQEIDPLDVIELGMVRFVLAPPNANWDTLVDKPEHGPRAKTQKRKDASSWQFLNRSDNEAGVNRIILPLLLVLVLVGGSIWYFSQVERDTAGVRLTTAEAERIVRETLDQFPFGKSVKLRVEADGTIFANGFVQDNFERRALLQAIEEKGVPVNFRLGVIDALKTEIAGLIRAERLPVDFDISPKGDLTLKGVVLDNQVATQFVDRIRESVLSLNSVTSDIKTAEIFLDEVQKLSRQTEIDSYVLLRLDGDLIEASGIIPSNRIDGWEGFLQAYVRRYVDHIGLRSFVQLQAPDGSLSPASTNGKLRPIVLNGKKLSEDDIVLDPQKLAQGQYQTPEFFARFGDEGKSGASPAETASTSSAGSPLVGGSAFAAGRPEAIVSGTDGPPLTTQPFEARSLAEASNDLIAKWRDGKMSPEQADDITKLARARAELLPHGQGLLNFENGLTGVGKKSSRQKALEKFFPLFAIERVSGIAGSCRSGSRLRPANIPVALFWLDLLSVSKSFSLTGFKKEEQAFILEAALDPSLVRECLAKGNVSSATPSVYLTETERNPGFVRFLTRQFETYPMDVSGASLIDSRYIQMRSGEKVGEGGAPDTSSRLAIVGELGAAIQKEEGFWTVIYNPAMNWLSQE